jgi:hypothetical protein
VHNISTWVADVERVAQQAGGYVERAERNDYWYSGDMRVPSDMLHNVLEQLSHVDTLVSVTGQTLTRKDITDVYSDAEARVAVLQASRTQLIELMTKAKSVAETIQVEDRLTNINSQLDVLLGQIKRMDGDVAYSTVSLHANRYWNQHSNEFSFIEVVNRAVQVLTTIAQRLLVGCIYAVVFIPFALLVAVVLYFVVRAALNRLPRN